MAYVQSIESIDNASAPTSPTNVDRLIHRAGLALVEWAKWRETRRSQRLAARLEDPKRDVGMLDPDAPRAVRRFGFVPGAFK